jgi:iron(II)-dependent oxidoreductase
MVETVAVELHAVMEEVRERTFRLVEHLDPDQMTTVLSPIMSPLSWDLGHVAAYEDLWLNHRLAGRELLREDLAALYDAFETPRAVRGDLQFLRDEALREYMADVRRRALEAPPGDGELHELVIRHELQHTETMLQAMALAGITPPSFAGPAPVTGTGLEMLEVPEGPFEQGTGPEGFAYDNERPRHTASTARFTIARTPVTNATWRAWIEDGGYARRELWSAKGWAWREREGITGHAGGADDAPVVHVTCFEAGPSPRRTRPGCRPSPNGRRRRPGWTAPARSGSGRRVTSPPTQVSRRIRTGSTRKCSSATTTGCCAGVPVPRTRGSPPRSSATGTCPNAGSSLPESGSRDEDGAG